MTIDCPKCGKFTATRKRIKHPPLSFEVNCFWCGCKCYLVGPYNDKKVYYEKEFRRNFL